MDPTQQGEVRLHSWHLYTSQAPVLDLTNKPVTTTTQFLEAFQELNLSTDTDETVTQGIKISTNKERQVREN